MSADMINNQSQICNIVQYTIDDFEKISKRL